MFHKYQNICKLFLFMKKKPTKNFISFWVDILISGASLVTILEDVTP